MRTRHLMLIMVTLVVLVTQTGCRAAQAQELGSYAAAQSPALLSAKTDVRTSVYLVKPEMRPETRERLKSVYRGDIMKLQDLIHRDLSHWLE